MSQADEEQPLYRQRRFSLPPDATEIVLLRHGASAPAVPGKPFPMVDGHGDPPLAPDGVEQAALAARRLAAEAPDVLFVSGLTRTVQTCAPLAEATGLEPVAIPDLREVKLGEWEAGEYRIRMINGDPIAMRALREERWDIIPGAESAESLTARVRAGIERVVELTGPGRTAVAVVHGGIVGEVCRQATASRPLAFVHAENCSISRLIVWHDGRWHLRSFNDTCHLDGR